MPRSIKCWHCGKKTSKPKKYGHHYYCSDCYSFFVKMKGKKVKS